MFIAQTGAAGSGRLSIARESTPSGRTAYQTGPSRGRPRAASGVFGALTSLLAILVLTATPSQAQTSGDRPPRLVFTDRVEVQWTLIPTVIREGGELVEGLTVEDFELRIDQRPAAIETFEARTDAPASVVFLQDLSGSMLLLDKLEASRRALHRLLGSAIEGDEFALATFAGSHLRMTTPFTEDNASLIEASARWRAEGTTGLYDAITWLPELSMKGRQARRAAVVVTDGIDNASQIDPEEARRHVLRTPLPVYVLDLSHFGRSASPAVESGHPLPLLASGTGGRYFRPLTADQLTQAGEEIARELRQQYVLGFASDSTRDGSVHQVEVRVPSRRAHARHRPEYFGPPPNWLDSVASPHPR